MRLEFNLVAKPASFCNWCPGNSREPFRRYLLFILKRPVVLKKQPHKNRSMEICATFCQTLGHCCDNPVHGSLLVP